MLPWLIHPSGGCWTGCWTPCGQALALSNRLDRQPARSFARKRVACPYCFWQCLYDLVGHMVETTTAKHTESRAAQGRPASMGRPKYSKHMIDVISRRAGCFKPFTNGFWKSKKRLCCGSARCFHAPRGPPSKQYFLCSPCTPESLWFIIIFLLKTVPGQIRVYLWTIFFQVSSDGQDAWQNPKGFLGKTLLVAGRLLGYFFAISADDLYEVLYGL